MIFNHIYNLGEHWFKKFKQHYYDIYDFVYENDEEIFVYDRNHKHILTYLPYDETVFTNLPTQKVYEDISYDDSAFPKKILIPESVLEYAGGAGYSVWGGGGGGNFGNPTSGGKFYGRGFGFGQSSSNKGGPNIMYTYDIKPLNQLLQQMPTPQEGEKYLHVGCMIKGKILGKKGDIEGKILSIDQDADGNIRAYIVADPKTTKKVRVDPTSAEVVEYDPTPGMAMRDVVGESYYPKLKDFLNE
jgi:hypothetical protein